MTAKLTVVVNSLNEAHLLPRLIKSVKGLASEILVIDMESTDDTKPVAKKLGAKVYSHKRLEYIEPSRNFAIEKASGDWVLILDADEEIPESLSDKIREIVTNDKYDYVRIPRKNVIFGHFMKYSNWWPDYNVRLFKKGKVKWSDVIHAVPDVAGEGYDIEAKEENAIMHHTYDSIEKYLEHLNRYTTVQASLKIKSGYKFVWKDLLIRPANEFLSRYFLDEGYKDGVYGLALSLLQAFSELVFYLKVWQTEKFVEQNVTLKEVISEMRLRERDLHFWQNDAVYKETGDIKARFRRKLRI